MVFDPGPGGHKVAVHAECSINAPKKVEIKVTPEQLLKEATEVAGRLKSMGSVQRTGAMVRLRKINPELHAVIASILNPPKAGPGQASMPVGPGPGPAPRDLAQEADNSGPPKDIAKELETIPQSPKDIAKELEGNG